MITALRFSSLASRSARAASVARRSLPQISTSKESEIEQRRRRTSGRCRRPQGRANWPLLELRRVVMSAPAVNVGELVRPRDPQIGARRIHPRHGLAQIVVLHERGSDQLLQLLVLEDLEPFQVRQRSEIGWRRGVAAAAKDVRRLDDRPAVFWADRAAGQQAGH